MNNLTNNSTKKMVACWVEAEHYIYYDRRSLQITDISKIKKDCDLFTNWIYLTEPKNMKEIREILEDKEQK